MANRANRRPSEAAVDAWRAILRSHQVLLMRLDEDLRREHAITIEWYDVLYQLHHGGGRLRMNDLGERLLISKSNCTRLIDRMAKAGLVNREAAPEDRRGTQAVITTAGEQTLRRAAPTHLDGLARYVDQPLSAGSLTDIAQSLEKIIAHIESDNAPK